MSLSPQVLLSAIARQRCVANIKDMSEFIIEDAESKYKASVLVPLCVENGEVCLLYTLRSTNLKTHKGQVSFPGGKRDKDENVVETALRETEEEIGIPPQDIDVWEKMPSVLGVNYNIVITPIVGLIKDFDESKLDVNVFEVEEVFRVPMSAFCDKNNHASILYKDYFLPVFLYGKYKIWGITGLITHFFLQCFLPNNVYEGDFLKKTFTMEELLPSKL